MLGIISRKMGLFYMLGEYSYADIALEDLQAAKELLKAHMYNHSTRLCQQFTEKMLKDIISHMGTEERDMYLLSVHNIVKLATRVAELTSTNFSKEDIGFFRGLTDYYFDTNYPGENYVRITKEEARDVYFSTIEFAERLQLLASQHIADTDTLYTNHKKFINSETIGQQK